VKQKRLITRDEIERRLNTHVLPVWKDREFTSIRRNDVATLLDDVEDDHSGNEADHVLAIVRAIMAWHALRHDDYDSPIIPGMRRTSPKEIARKRTLTDDESGPTSRMASGRSRILSSQL
jgi:hypothetical protein